MTLFELYNSAFTHVHWAELVLRIVIATVCGSVVGLERSWRFKNAGIRTHSMVACTAALLMIVSKYGFADLSNGDVFFPGVRGGDPARIAAQVVSGVSFLGAGIIYRDRNFTTRGLTTAAGIWAVSGIGLAVGSGMYLIGIFTTVLLYSASPSCTGSPSATSMFPTLSWRWCCRAVPPIQRSFIAGLRNFTQASARPR